MTNAKEIGYLRGYKWQVGGGEDGGDGKRRGDMERRGEKGRESERKREERRTSFMYIEYSNHLSVHVRRSAPKSVA
jgi:hypothetical protein